MIQQFLYVNSLSLDPETTTYLYYEYVHKFSPPRKVNDILHTQVHVLMLTPNFLPYLEGCTACHRYATSICKLEILIM